MQDRSIDLIRLGTICPLLENMVHLGDTLLKMPSIMTICRRRLPLAEIFGDLSRL